QEVSETSNFDVPKATTDCQAPGSCDEAPEENTGESEDLAKYIAANRARTTKFHAKKMFPVEALCTFEDTGEKRSRNRNIWIKASHK
ncbi:hypothetical protein DNTS_033548, partial [Danionella cerebrum]